MHSHSHFQANVVQQAFHNKINPFTVFFWCYGDNYPGNQAFSLTQKDRTFFIKLSDA